MEGVINKKLIAGLLIGALFLYLTLREINIASCWLYMKHANALWILLAVFVYSTAFIFRGFRWKLLIEPLKDCVPAGKLFSLLIIGFFMNNVLPLRLGEIIRANVAGQKLSIPRAGALATILVERLFDGVSYIALFFITIMFLPFPKWAKESFMLGSVVFGGLLVAFYVLLKQRELATRLVCKIPLPAAIRERAQSMFISFIDGLKVFAKGSALINVFLLSLVVWTIEASVYLLIGNAFNIHLSLFQCFFVMVIIGMGAILPTAPGFVGTVEFLGVTSLAFLGVNKNLAFGYIITLHLLQLITISLLGIRSLVAEKITFGELVKLENR